MTQPDTQPTSRARLSGTAASALLATGVLIVPTLLTVAFNSYFEPSYEDSVRMAFAQVAGATVAITTVVAFVVYGIVRRVPAKEIVWFAVIALAVVAWQVNHLINVADLLVNRPEYSGEYIPLGGDGFPEFIVED